MKKTRILRTKENFLFEFALLSERRFVIGYFQWRVLIGCRLIHKGQQLNGNFKIISRNLDVHEMTQNRESTNGVRENP